MSTVNNNNDDNNRVNTADDSRAKTPVIFQAEPQGNLTFQNGRLRALKHFETMIWSLNVDCSYCRGTQIKANDVYGRNIFWEVDSYERAIVGNFDYARWEVVIETEEMKTKLVGADDDDAENKIPDEGKTYIISEDFWCKMALLGRLVCVSLLSTRVLIRCPSTWTLNSLLGDCLYTWMEYEPGRVYGMT